MANKLTLYDRSARADAIRQVRENRLNVYKASPPAASQEPEEEKAGVGKKLLATYGDLAANLWGGALKGVEGVVDFATGLIPYIGVPGFGLLGVVGGAVAGQRFKDELQEFIAKDWVGTYVADPLQNLTKDSYLNQGKAGEIIEGVVGGVGQMLPAVAVTLATGGAGASTAVSQAAALATTAFGAAGGATEEAFKEGAGYEQGLLYGTAVGAVEAGTEKLLPGLGGLYGNGAKAAAKSLGKSTLKQVGKEVAEVGLKRVAKEAIGEGVEEMISETVSPTLKTIYKGKDALREYSDADFWGGVLEAGVIGAGTSVAYGGTVGRAMKTTGVYADANSVAEHIEEQKKLRGKAGLSQADRVQIEQNIKADQELLSGRLQKLSEKKRAKVFEKMPTFKAMFEADGTVKAEQAAALDAKIKAAEDTTYSADIRSSTADAERITEALKNGSTEEHEMRAFTGEMTEDQSKNADAVREFMGAVSERSGGVVGDYVIAEKAPEGPAYFDKKTGLTVIGMDAVENGTALEAVTRELEKAGWQEAVVHETFHTIEDTNAGKELAKLVTDNETLRNLAITDVLKRRYLQDFFGKDGKKADAKTVADGVAKLIERENNGEVLTESEQEALDEYRDEVAAFANQRLLGNKAFVKKLITTEPSTAEKLIAKIREIREDLKVRKDPEAKAQLELVRKAEKLFMQGLSEAGGTIDAAGKIHLANREEDEEKGKVRRLANPKSVDNLTEEQYNNFGWVRANDVLNSGEWKDFTSKFADAVTKQTNPPKTKGGEYMIAVSDIDDALHYGTDNIIVYAKGSIESPQVSRILKIDLDNETDLDRERRKIYVTARRGLQPTSGGVFRFYASTDFGRGLYEQGKRHQEWQNNGQFGTDRGRGRRTTDRIKEFKVNDDGSFTTTYADGRVVTEPPKVRRSRNVTGETVTISKGEMAKLHANYAGDKVFAKGAVTEALKGIDALKALSAERRREIANEIWTGYNKRLHQQGFELFTELAWHQI
ncbi:MAG: hypothetical protein E7590_07440, partial [Ruminococcaceae bacterium]|nr:hypothetical protein [Oscillospiraceae bacterium]